MAVRGELFRRHPRAAVYAVRAVSRSVLADESVTQNVEYPIFSGAIEPDVRFFGFGLSAADAVGTTLPAAPPGWFFVFQEQPTETRFGPPASGDPLAGTGTTAADVAQRTLHPPIRVAIHASALLEVA